MAYRFIRKFFAVNGGPLGMVFYLAFLYAVIKVFQSPNKRRHLGLFVLSILGCGFLYPPMFPGLVAGTAAICMGAIVLKKWLPELSDSRTIFWVVICQLLTLVLLYPYWKMVSSGVSKTSQIFNVLSMLQNMSIYCIISLPLSIIAWLTRKSLKLHLNKTPAAILLLVMAATAGIYICIYLPRHAEYKFLMLSNIILGIFGGISFYFLSRKYNKIIVFIVLALFFYPAFDYTSHSLNYYSTIPVNYIHKGENLRSANSEEQELFDWIQKHTAIDSVFIDTELTIPIFARRCLFVGMSTGKWSRGYGFMNIILNLRHGYEISEIEFRENIVHKIYNTPELLTNQEVKELSTFDNLYVVVHENVLADNLSQIQFFPIFKTSQKNYRIYQCKIIDEYPEASNSHD